MLIDPETHAFDKRKQILAGFKSGKSCVANMIVNSKDEILLLKRSPNDNFHPSTWCLPGGGIESGESVIKACYRETKEETDVELKNGQTLFLGSIKCPNADVFYFRTDVDDDEIGTIVLDEKEHCNYQWCSAEQWLKMELILDLKDHLCTIQKIDNL
jgi:ADP-ribose pyrophosphatase YjhB (NUDIX family)